jgi:hypothetical protein
LQVIFHSSQHHHNYCEADFRSQKSIRHLYFVNADPAAGIQAMLKHAEEIVRTKPRPVNPAPLILKNGEVADFFVSENSPIFNDVERAKKVSALFYYQQQTETLKKLYEQKGKDLFVAN